MIVARELALYASKFAMFVLIRRVMVPPYCGFPRMSHQFPVFVVVVVVGLRVGVEVDVVRDVGVDVDVGVTADFWVDVVVDAAQDARTSDITIRQISNTQITLFFI